MKIRILSSALDDLVGSHRFYERRREGLGDYFLASLFADIQSLSVYGGIHAKVSGFHRLLSKRFPHAVYYKIEDGNTIVVFRVLGQRQDPKNIESALN